MDENIDNIAQTFFFLLILCSFISDTHYVIKERNPKLDYVYDCIQALFIYSFTENKNKQILIDTGSMEEVKEEEVKEEKVQEKEVQEKEVKEEEVQEKEVQEDKNERINEVKLKENVHIKKIKKEDIKNSQNNSLKKIKKKKSDLSKSITRLDKNKDSKRQK